MKYDEYHFSKKEWLLIIVEYLGIDGMISFLFYDSVYAFLIILPLFFVFYKFMKGKYMEKRLDDLKKQFIQMITYMATALSAGLTIDNSLKEAKKDIEKMFEKDSVMAQEMEAMIGRMDMGMRLEDVMDDFSYRSGVQEIKDFATVFGIAKKSGGRFSEIIDRCALMMTSSQETENQIQIMISGKKYEQRILMIVPFMLIAILRYTTGDFIRVLYHNAFGIGLMTLCLVIYAGSVILAEKISDIKC